MNLKYFTRFELTNEREKAIALAAKRTLIGGLDNLKIKLVHSSNSLTQCYQSIPKSAKFSTLGLVILAGGIAIGKNIFPNIEPEQKHYVRYSPYIDRGHNEIKNGYFTDKEIKSLRKTLANIVSIDEYDKGR